MLMQKHEADTVEQQQKASQQSTMFEWPQETTMLST
jgi:hypothetical protein